MGFIDAITAVAEPRCLDDCDAWCVGLPLVKVRSLDDSELKILRDQVAEQYARQQVVSVTFASVFACLYIAAILFPNPVTFDCTAISAGLICIFVVWLFCDPDSWLRRYRSLQADVAAGIAHCFSDLKADPGVLEVLPRSEVVYVANHVSPRKWRHVPIVAVAKTPSIASMALDWLQPVDGPLGRFFSGKRALSVAERSEIKRWTAQVLDERRRHAVTYVCWAVFLGWLCRFGNPDLFYAALAFTGYTGSCVYAELLSVLALKKDAEEGIVVINRRATCIDGDVKPFGSPSEFLPKAKLKWTEAGQPADWRKLP